MGATGCITLCKRADGFAAVRYRGGVFLLVCTGMLRLRRKPCPRRCCVGRGGGGNLYASMLLTGVCACQDFALISPSLVTLLENCLDDAGCGVALVGAHQDRCRIHILPHCALARRHASIVETVLTEFLPFAPFHLLQMELGVLTDIYIGPSRYLATVIGSFGTPNHK